MCFCELLANRSFFCAKERKDDLTPAITSCVVFYVMHSGGRGLTIIWDFIISNSYYIVK